MAKSTAPVRTPEELLNHLVHINDETQKHTSALLTIGYASYFGFWQITNEFLSKTVALSSALLMIASISLFIFFEIWKSYLRSRLILTLNHKLSAIENPENEQLSKISEESQKAFKRLSAKQSKVWVFVFWPTLGFGAASLALLLAAFAYQIVLEL